MSVPAPPSGSAVVNVKVGGDRIGGNAITAQGAAGATLRLSGSEANANSWQAYPWATCVSDADGDCSFIIPVKTSGTTDARAMRSNVQPDVHQISAPAGWHLNTNLRTGSGNGTDSPNTNVTYRFQIAQTIESGATYQSTSSDFEFMVTSRSNTDLDTSAGI